MKSLSILSAAAAGAALMVFAGCAGTEESLKPSDVNSPREYRTGSNIPIKDPAPPMTPEERERQAEAIRTLQRTGSPGKPKS